MSFKHNECLKLILVKMVIRACILFIFFLNKSPKKKEIKL